MSNVSSPASRRKLLSTCERFIKEKKQEKSKCDEANVKQKELEETSAEIKDYMQLSCLAIPVNAVVLEMS